MPLANESEKRRTTMGKIKKMVLGMVLAVSVFGSSISLCHAASSSIDVGITATNAWGSFMYDEPGHHLKVTVYYLERKADGKLQMGEASAHQFGNFISVYVSRPSPSGCQYENGYATGYVDDVSRASSARVYVN